MSPPDRWLAFSERERDVIGRALEVVQADWMAWSSADEPEMREKIALARGLEMEAKP